jgi:HPt (histidine-containing phosphotransfer) domain-containing protein
LGAVNGDRDLYIRLLSSFHRRHGDIADKIQGALNAKSYNDARRWAHTAKGVSGTIGAKELSDISFQIESAIKTNARDSLSALLTRFASEIQRVIGSVERFLKSEVEGRTNEIHDNGDAQIKQFSKFHASRVKELSQELSDLIEKRDSDALQIVADLKVVLGPEKINNEFLKLESHLNRFAFESAKDALAQTLAKLNLFIDRDHE